MPATAIVNVQSATVDVAGNADSRSPNPKSPPSAQYACHAMNAAVHANA